MDEDQRALLVRIDERQKNIADWIKAHEKRMDDIEESLRENTAEINKGRVALWVLGAMGSVVVGTTAFVKDLFGIVK